MPMAAFDTISVARRLETEFEMPTKQAEGVALILHENFVGNVATKDDVKGLKDEVKGLKDDIKTLHGDIKTLDDKIDASVTTLNDKIDASVTTLNDKIGTLDKKIDTGLIEVKGDLKWIKLIGGVIVGLLVLPLLTDLAEVLLSGAGGG